MTDARFEDGAVFADQPLRLVMASAEDLDVVSSLVQDAVGKTGEISWMPRRNRLVMLLNRFRWEDREAAEKSDRKFERVRTALIFDSARAVRSRGLDPKDGETTYAILRLSWEPGEDAEGRIVVMLAGDGDLAVDVECVDGQLTDLSRPWEAHARAAPDHGLGDD